MRTIAILFLSCLCACAQSGLRSPAFVSNLAPKASGSSFSYTSVQFDGANDYLTRGANLTGISDSKVGTVSFWIKFTGGDGDFVALIYTTDVGQMAINDGTDTGALSFALNANIAYSTLTDWSIGALPGGGVKITALVSEFWFDTRYVGDLTSAPVRAKFNVGGHPVSLGADGSTPTGFQPLIYLHTAVPSWEANLGSGGGLTENGTLTDGGGDKP
jgi:hypothetical protein